MKRISNRAIKLMETNPPVGSNSVDSLINDAINMFTQYKYDDPTTKDIEWAIGVLMLADLKLREHNEK